MIARVPTALLEVAYESDGPADGRPVFLLHGWPDDVRTYDGVAPALQAAGFRTFAPWLRGFGPTRFRAADTMRSGQIAALAQDVVDVADALGIERFSIVGHDWGSRIAYLLAATMPQRIESIAVMSVGWSPGEPATPPLDQAQAFWYQWFMATERGAGVVRSNARGFARRMWETWSPPGWFHDAAFDATAVSFDNPDWAAITLHSYRVRWGQAQADPRYAGLESRAMSARAIAVPALLIQGGDDRCVLPDTTAGNDEHFSGGYRRVVLPGIGHFPTREAAQDVSGLVVEFLRRA